MEKEKKKKASGATPINRFGYGGQLFGNVVQYQRAVLKRSSVLFELTFVFCRRLICLSEFTPLRVDVEEGNGLVFSVTTNN